MSSSPESAAPLPDPKALRARAWSAGSVVFVSVAALVGCEAPEDAGNGAREGEVLAQAQEALVCREGALDASKTFAPLALPTYADANVTFSPPLNFKLPAQIPVTQGNSGHGRVVLTFATSSGPVTCKYEGAHLLPFHVESELPAYPGDKYVFLSCSNGAMPGASVTTTSLNVHVKTASFLAGTTKVHLAYVEPQPCGGGFDCGAAMIDDGNACTTDACERRPASRTRPSRPARPAPTRTSATAPRRATALGRAALGRLSSQMTGTRARPTPAMRRTASRTRPARPARPAQTRMSATARRRATRPERA